MLPVAMSRTDNQAIMFMTSYRWLTRDVFTDLGAGASNSTTSGIIMAQGVSHGGDYGRVDRHAAAGTKTIEVLNVAMH